MQCDDLSDGVMTRAKKRKLEMEKKSQSICIEEVSNGQSIDFRDFKIVLIRLTHADITNYNSNRESTASTAPKPAERNDAIANRTIVDQSNEQKKNDTSKNNTIETQPVGQSNNDSNPIQTTMAQSSQIPTTVAIITFSPNEIVWGKIKGSVHWPAKIDRIINTARGYMYEIRWYNDHRRTKVGKNQIFKFLPNFESFAVNFDKVVGVKAAALEAMIDYKRKMK